jgi:hypothetical protein
MKKAFIWKFLGIIMLFLTAAAPLTQSSDNPIPIDNFEKYTTDKAIQKAYTVWSDGALMQVTVQGGPEDRSMHVDILSANPSNQATTGSIYHVLSGSQRDWSGASAVRFAIENSSSETLSLSFNFKEAYNEYWAVASQGAFFLQDENGNLLQQDIAYGNLPIPANYQGWVLIPFFSFAVPDWNTARGNQVMNLEHIESLAFSVNLGAVLPQTFSIDDIELLPDSGYAVLDIQGARSIQIPASGEHHEPYFANQVSPVDQSTQPVEVQWSLADTQDGLISIGTDGTLVIPSTAHSGNLILQAAFAFGSGTITREISVELTGGQTLSGANTQSPTAVTVPTQAVLTAYDQFSQNFEVWAVQNRLLFVFLSIAVILLIVVILTLLQRRLK